MTFVFTSIDYAKSKARSSVPYLTAINKAIGRKEYTELRRIFVWIQGARQAHRERCNCYCNAEAGR